MFRVGDDSEILSSLSKELRKFLENSAATLARDDSVFIAAHTYKGTSILRQGRAHIFQRSSLDKFSIYLTRTKKKV